jgi:hypothetical protein
MKMLFVQVVALWTHTVETVKSGFPESSSPQALKSRLLSPENASQEE